ncbi:MULTISPECIES: PFL_4703 family integrating conjugative element protein [Vibrio]|uniref:PFL_4703 family integrating conjugative element protein n=1 Tax=Vibrio TaxID=662 RepID=UPI000841AD45|nr:MULTISPECIES: TIGR03746 family integrating conjugative element protein [Vibrio]ODM56063.1 integrating conjugative element protein [Vibrio harveyi]USD58520.1 TIGR03746 family integrating conjugative element protein [Vibrio sp. SCSIO 43155]
MFFKSKKKSDDAQLSKATSADSANTDAINTLLKSPEKTDENQSEIFQKGKLPKRMVARFKEHDSHIATLRSIIFGLSIALGMSIYSNSQAPKQLRIRIPPDITNGAVLSPNDFPKASILSDVAYLWTAMNTWEKNGVEDTKDNLHRWQYFFSPDFLAQLAEEYRELKFGGFLKRKKRSWYVGKMLSEFDERVVKTSNQTWTVYIDMATEETYLGKVVKETVIRYPLLVERFDSNIEYNPLGIRIVGYAQEPYRIEK